MIDLAITNKPNFIIDSDVLSCPVGDHELVTVTISVRKERTPPPVRTFRSLENYSQSQFCDLFLNETSILSGILRTENVDEQVSIFSSVFVKCLDVCAPFVSKGLNDLMPPGLMLKYKMH